MSFKDRSGPMQQHPILGWIPSVPEPYWGSHWFRSVPCCYECRIKFKNRDDYERHWVTTHSGVGGVS